MADMKWVDEAEHEVLEDMAAQGFSNPDPTGGRPALRKLVAAATLAERETTRALEQDVLMPVDVAEILGRLQIRLRSGNMEGPEAAEMPELVHQETLGRLYWESLPPAAMVASTPWEELSFGVRAQYIASAHQLLAKLGLPRILLARKAK